MGEGKRTRNSNKEFEFERGRRKGADIADRLMEVCAFVIELARELPPDFLGRHVAAQIIRSSTSGGANYEEARSAESRADFIHKIRLATKEIRETTFWLRLIRRSALAGASRRVDSAIAETGELVAILTASARTARASSGS